VEYLSGDLDALVAGSLDDFIVGTVDLGSVKDVADTFEHVDVYLRSIDPCIALLVKEPFMDAAIGDGHTWSPLSEVPEISYCFFVSESVSGFLN
jgi:hypothetical protein